MQQNKTTFYVKHMDAIDTRNKFSFCNNTVGNALTYC